MNSNKPKYIEAIYSQAVQFNLEAYGIDWDDVLDYWVKYGTLHIQYKDGTWDEYDAHFQPDIDWKHPTSTGVYDKDWKEVSDDND